MAHYQPDIWSTKSVLGKISFKKTSTNKSGTKIVYLWKCISHIRLCRAYTLKRLALRLLVGFLLIHKCGFKGCAWTSTICWRSPPAFISRHSNHLKHEDIYSVFRSLLHIYSTLWWILTMTAYKVNPPNSSVWNVHKQAHCLITMSHNKSKKLCEQSNSWSEPWLRRFGLHCASSLIWMHFAVLYGRGLLRL